MDKNRYALLMAGGVGSRFWPVSTEENPKQFHDMLGTGKSLLQQTFARLAKTVPQENILILTNKKYKTLVHKHLPKIAEHRIVLEPVLRNTAPCVLLAALKVRKENPDALMVVAPSDTWIADDGAFTADVDAAFQVAEKGNSLVTLGIQPTFPTTGYGYIRTGEIVGNAKRVREFTEKPDAETAKSFLEQGNYLWNAGIFIWSVKTILDEFQKHLPAMASLFKRGTDVMNTEREQDFIDAEYPKSENISIDYGIMEKAEAVYVIPATFDWTDLGTWGALYDKSGKDGQENAVVNADLLAMESTGNIIHLGKKKKVVLDGLDDYIIVNTDEVLLIVPKSKEQDIKEIRALAQGKSGK